ncbi:MAG: gamma-glutamyltransferase [Alphaproteobacteria bacterium]|nr:gamma-glutamyltransferase [Alphaproteobacteria bacterium]
MDRPLSPEIATATQVKKQVQTGKFMAVMAHPDATKAAYNILAQGGTAADAAIAAQMVLGLVEPQSSGLGGGGFVLYYDAQKKTLLSLDGRETAPETASQYLFIGRDGKPMGFYNASIGGRAVGVPGLLKMLEELHHQKGKMPWADLFSPAIQRAEEGFTVSERLHRMLVEERPRFQQDVIAQLYFYPDTVEPIAAGSQKRNPDYAVTLRRIAEKGIDSFYNGEIGEAIVKKVRHSDNAGLLAIEDLRDYKAIERKPVCAMYRGYEVCSMGQPSSGGLTLLEILGMVEHYDLAKWGAENPKSWHVISEASHLAFADRNKYMVDPDFVASPNTLLLQPDYLKARAALINIDKAMLEVQAGIPPGWNDQQAMAADHSLKPPGTTHMNIVDGYGNILSMTSSIENAFGSRLMTGGFLLNNQLTDFAFDPIDEEGMPVANRVEGGKRPRSSMTPVIIFDKDGKPFMAIGSAGGSRIIGFVLERIISVIDWHMDLQDAMNAPNILHRGQKLEVEKSAVKFAEPLKNLGHPVLVGEMNSGLTAIMLKDGKIYGAADPRRDGIAMGQ